jgi:hypothetical protein
MQLPAQNRSLYRTQRPEIDRQAINAACHLLLGAIWLERRVAMRLVTLAERVDTRGSVDQRQHSGITSAIGYGSSSRA